MKKLLIPSFIAIVAISGTYANDYAYNYGGPSELRFTCQAGDSTCVEFASYPLGSLTDVSDPNNPIPVDDHSIFLFLMRVAE